ncbi:hypothetical protein [Streptomyces rhizosphaericus]|uniref:hypothetical protein n=1 Tax=Streptomyces rhizosphaericus TaxID=114699 RepID=UPI000A3738B6|nr:hypothetical protein [Streptomyces rhizosphaericus]
MKPFEEIRESFALLPRTIDVGQIAEATGRKPLSVRNNWIYGGTGFPAGGEGRYDRDAVLDWIARQPFARADRPSGPRGLAARASQVPPLALRLSITEIAEILDVNRRTVDYHVGRNRPENTDDAFPAADIEGLRAWPEVRSWFLRHEGGTPGPDDEPVLLEKAIGEQCPKPTAAWLAQQLGIATETAEGILRVNTNRLRPLALAREVGITYDALNHYARTYTPDTSEDPFPAADDRNTRDAEEVRTWLGRNTTPAPPADTGRLGPSALARAVGIGRGSIHNYARTYTPDTSEDPFPAADDRNTRDPEEVRAWLRRRGK